MFTAKNSFYWPECVRESELPASYSIGSQTKPGSKVPRLLTTIPPKDTDIQCPVQPMQEKNTYNILNNNIRTLHFGKVSLWWGHFTSIYVYM